MARIGLMRWWSVKAREGARMWERGRRWGSVGNRHIRDTLIFNILKYITTTTTTILVILITPYSDLLLS